MTSRDKKHEHEKKDAPQGAPQDDPQGPQSPAEENQGGTPAQDDADPATAAAPGPHGAHGALGALAKKEEELRSYQSQLMRLKAEFDNYRKRVEKEKELRYRFGKQSVLLKLVELTDVMDSAVKHAAQASGVKEILSGLELLRKEFFSFLTKEGMKKIETSGKSDPHLHEIVGYEERDEAEDGVIINEVQPGFLYEDEVVRPARVIISRKKTESAGSGEASNKERKE